MSSIDQKLRSVCGGFPGDQRQAGCLPHGVLDWELAFTAERAQERLERAHRSDAGDLLPDLRRSLELDRLFIAGYVGLFAAAIGLATACFDPSRRRRWLWLLPFPFVAGSLDVAENALLRRQLAGGAIDTSLAWAAGTAAALKFLFLMVPALALTALAVAWLTRRLSTSRVERAHALESVVAAERGYLDGRRARAGLAGGLLSGEPIGLAFSGGGIRSATFNLGVLQALGRLRLLPLFDYLSTVSGGGYIGAALSSLLSINGRRADAAAAGSRDQHEFAPGDEPLFSTRAESFPFARDSPQLGALRASSEFLVGRRRLFSMEMLRAIGSTTFGFLYHLIHFGLALVALASGYLWVVYLMVGKAEDGADPTSSTLAGWRPAAGLERPLSEVYREYFREVIGLDALAQGAPWWEHPFFLAFVAGGLVAAAAVWLSRRVVEALPDGWYARRGRTAEDGRQEDLVLALVVIMLLAATTVTWWLAAVERERINISLPLVSYLGGGTVLFARHAVVAMRKRYHRYDRSQLAARQGALVYLLVASVILVLVILPSLVFFEPLKEILKDRPVRGVMTWLITVAGARLFAGSVGGRSGDSSGLLGKLLPVARKIVLGAVFIVALVGSLVLICVVIWTSEPEVGSELRIGALTITGPAAYRFGLGIAALIAYFVSGRLNFNKLSLHYFYRDRLAEAYLRTSRREASSDVVVLRNNEGMQLRDLHGRAADGDPDGDPACVTSAPYHLIQTCLNLTGGREKVGRKTDRFIFSKLYCGSRTTGFLETRAYRGGRTSLARAMTISGAAASPAMGSATFFAQSAAMTLLNVRLGQWIENPGYRGGVESGRRESSIWWPKYLLKEVTASTDAQSRLVYLSDGGHSGDNLGLCPLLERRCRLIVAVDAEQDAALELGSFNEALRQIRIDDGVEVEIDLKPLVPQKPGGPSAAHVAIGKIAYPGTDTRPAATGWLILLKASMTGDESGPISSYRKKNPDFPHESTGDQFFDEAQFESYRELGEHVVEASLEGELLHLMSAGLSEPANLWNEAFEELAKRAPASAKTALA